MLLTKKIKSIYSERPSEQIPSLQKLCNLVADKCFEEQKRMADVMQKGSEHLSITGKKFVLMIFCFVGIGASIYASTENIFFKKHPFHLTNSSIALSKNALEKGFKTSDFLSETEFDKIQNFKNYIDSLSKSTAGKKIKDSILKNRPLLMDSINQLEKLFQINGKLKK